MSSLHNEEKLTIILNSTSKSKMSVKLPEREITPRGIQQQFTITQERSGAALFPEYGEPRSFYHTYTKNILSSNLSGEISRYSIPFNQDTILIGSRMIINIPAVKIQHDHIGKIRIAWCKHLFNAMVKKAECYVKSSDGLKFDALDGATLNVRQQAYLEPGHEKELRESVGDVSILTNWSTEGLPAYPLTAEQPWFYGRKSHKGFPVFMMATTDEFIHDYQWELDISKLLRVQKLDGEVWRDICLEDEYLVSRLPQSIIVEDPKLRPPIMRARFAVLTAEERKKVFNCTELGQYSMFVETSQHLVEKTIGKIDLPSDIPIHQLVWVGIDSNAARYNRHNDYTINGYNPVIRWSIQTKNIVVDSGIGAESSRHGMSPALGTFIDEGYNGHYWMVDTKQTPVTIFPSYGWVPPSESTLTVTFGDTNPKVSLNPFSQEKREFSLEAIALYVKEIKLTPHVSGMRVEFC